MQLGLGHPRSTTSPMPPDFSRNALHCLLVRPYPDYDDTTDCTRGGLRLDRLRTVTLSSETTDLPALAPRYAATAWTDADDATVAVIRGLAMDAVQKVGNGHPGTAMSLAPAAHLLFSRYLRHDPTDPQWPGRDRFVLRPQFAHPLHPTVPERLRP